MMQIPFSFWKPDNTPKDMYYSNTGTGLWSDAANWFEDNLYTIPAGRVPTNGDTIYMNGSHTDDAPALFIGGYYGQGQANTSQTANLYVASTGSVNISLGYWAGQNDAGLTGGYFSGTASMAGIYTGNAEFHDTAVCEGQISQTGLFYDSSSNITNGSIYQPYFYDTSTNNGGGFADAIFYNSSDCVSGGGNSGLFYDSSTNSGGTFSMGAKFYNTSSNGMGGSINNLGGYIAEFFDSAINYGTCNAPAYFYNSSSQDLNGFCYDIAEFRDTTNNAGYLANGSFYDSSYDTGTTYFGNYYNSTSTSGVVGYGNFSDSSANNGFAYYDCYFYSTAGNYSTCDTVATFYDYTFNLGTVNGNGYFYSIAENVGTIGTDGYFYNSSKNYGTINGDGYFYDSSDQLGTVFGTTTCSTTGTCP